MGIARGILDWVDDQMEKIGTNIDEVKHPYVKAFGFGVIEGVIDSSVVWMPVLLAACCIKNKQIEELKK